MDDKEKIKRWAETSAKRIWSTPNGPGRRRGPETQQEMAQLLSVILESWERAHGRMRD